MMFYSFLVCTVRIQMWINVITVKVKCFKATSRKSYHHFHPFRRASLQAETSPLLTGRKKLPSILHPKYQTHLKWRWKTGCLEQEQTHAAPCYAIIGFLLPISRVNAWISLKIFQQVLCALTAHYNPSPVLHNIQNDAVQALPRLNIKSPRKKWEIKKDTYFQVSPLPVTALSEALLWCY